MDEKRRFPRLNTNVDVKWSKIESEPDNPSDGEENQDIARNISGGGICLIVNEKLDVGDKLSLEIDLPTDKISDIKARVVWVSEFEIIGTENESKYDIGIEFVDISDEDRELIKKFVFSLYNA